MESGAALRASRISAFLSIKYWSTGAIFEYLSDCAAAFGTRKPMLIASTKAMILIILSELGISAFLSIKYWSTGAIFEYLSDCAAAFGTRKPMLIASTKAMILIILSAPGIFTSR